MRLYLQPSNLEPAAPNRRFFFVRFDSQRQELNTIINALGFIKMTAHCAYFPAGGVTWESMDEALASIKGEQTEDEAKEMNAA